MGTFILVTLIVLFAKNLRCCAGCRRCRKKTKDGNDSSDDSFEEKDDICIEDAKPKNPFTFQKKLEEAKKNTNDPFRNERYKFFNTNSNMPAHARTK